MASPLTSPGAATAARAAFELELVGVMLSSLGRFTRAVKASAMAAGAPAAFALGETLGAWLLVVDDVVGLLSARGLDADYTRAARSRLSAVDLPSQVYESARVVLNQAATHGWSRQHLNRELTHAVDPETPFVVLGLTAALVPEEKLGPSAATLARMIARTEATAGYGHAALKVMAAFGRPEKRWVCILPGQRVSARAVLAVARRHHVGQVVTISTASGARLALTPDHRVLTGRGWVQAQSVHPGDHTFQVARPEASHGPDVQNRPPLIEEVFDAAVAVEPVEVWPVPVGVDLDSDASNSQVDVVRSRGNLFCYVESAHPKGLGDLAFASADVLGSVLTLGSRETGLMVGAGVSTLARSNQATSAAVSDVRGFGGSAQEARLGAVTDADARGEQEALDCGSGRTGLDSDSVQGLPAGVLTDEVIDVKISAWSGHVYDLTTADGWFLSEGHVIHNCHHDTRTRPTHAKASGQTAALGVSFQVGGYALLYPGDPSAPWQETANCRCTLVAVGKATMQAIDLAELLLPGLKRS